MKKLRMREIISSSHGQALLEFVLILPILMLILMGILQIGSLRESQIILDMAARQGMRVAAAGGDAKAAVESFLDGHPSIDGDRLKVDVSDRYLWTEIAITYEPEAARPFLSGNSETVKLETKCSTVRYRQLYDILPGFWRLFGRKR
jgi:Flp pilus assembly protein TadG